MKPWNEECVSNTDIQVCIYPFAYIYVHTRNIIDTSLFLQGRGRKAQEIKKEDEDHGERTAHGRARKGNWEMAGLGQSLLSPTEGRH